MSEFWLQKMGTYFVRIDIDRDGVITKKDFDQMADRFIAEGSLSAERGQALRESLFAVWEKFWHHLGGEDREKIEKSQFVDAMKQIVACPNAKEILKAPLPFFFAAVDANEDGQISEGEYSTFFKCIGIKADLAGTSFKAIDANNDGQLSMDEFVDAGMEFFTGEDTSNDTKYFWGPLL